MGVSYLSTPSLLKSTGAITSCTTASLGTCVGDRRTGGRGVFVCRSWRAASPVSDAPGTRGTASPGRHLGYDHEPEAVKSKHPKQSPPAKPLDHRGVGQGARRAVSPYRDPAVALQRAPDLVNVQLAVSVRIHLLYKWPYKICVHPRARGVTRERCAPRHIKTSHMRGSQVQRLLLCRSLPILP